MSRTRIKICGLTRPEDVAAVVRQGADALGFVFYSPSPRFVSPEQAARLAAPVPPFVSRVGLFVNAEPAFVRQVLAQVPLEVLQFHGDEDEAYCKQFARPYVKVARMRPGVDLLEFARLFPSAAALLLDTYVDGFGGAGQTFDWTAIPAKMPVPLVLAGGLTTTNVAQGIAQVLPYAVDVSSGVEAAKGIKDEALIQAFISAVQSADYGRGAAVRQ